LIGIAFSLRCTQVAPAIRFVIGGSIVATALLLVPSMTLATEANAGMCRDEGRALPLSEPPPDFGSKGNKKKFIEWITPAAQFIQAKTGLPMSVLIAQAGFESAWGSSTNFKVGRSIFGRSCGKKGNVERGKTELSDFQLPWEMTCSRPRPKAEGAYYYSFGSYRESILEYVQLLLKKGTLFGRLRTLVKNSPPPQVASSRACLTAIANRGYAHSSHARYLRNLTSIVATNRLEKLDKQAASRTESCPTSPNGETVVAKAAPPGAKQ
jgi:flagellum-specific peptidoglycan hydrolase FlgJ